FPVNAFTSHFNRLETLVAHIQANDEVWQAARTFLPLQTLEVRYEQMVLAREEALRAVCKFLEMDTDNTIPDHRDSASRSFINSPTYAEVLEPLHKRAVGRWRAYEEHLADSLPILNELACKQGYG
ncbi:MAG: sulfotransferase, partial [Verrucomicrobiota bacterium]